MPPTKQTVIDGINRCKAKKIKLAITDIDGILRGKYIHKNKFLSALEGGFGFCNVVFGWDANDLCYENSEFTGWHTGYPDSTAQIDLGSYRKVPWDNDVPFFLADFSNSGKDNEGLSVCPRTLLKRVVAKAKKLGLKALFAQEFEWFNFKETSESLEEKHYSSTKHLTPGMFGYSLLRASKNNTFFNQLFDQLEAFGVPLEGIHTETGPGVYEAAILYSDVLEAADRASLFKLGVKEIGLRNEIMPSFMAKINDKLPGCSGHLHQSLWDLEGKKNLFYDSNQSGPSELMKNYLAGLLHCLPQILPMYAPTINSYKRLVEGAWAPTTLTWGIDNRTTAIRLIGGSEKSTRIEFRVTGSDVNPYLAMAANLASGLYGVENKLELKTSPTQGNGYRDDSNGVLAKTLEESTDLMKNSEVASELFGQEFVDHFVKTRQWEWSQHLKYVTNWEVQRYFEII